MPQGTAIIKRCTQSSIGRAIALRLASDGFDIALAEEPSQQAELAALEYEIASKGVQCRSYFCDAAKEDEVKRLMEDVAADFGGIDVMVANNLVAPTIGPLVDISADEWDHTFRVTARFDFLCLKYAAQQMIKQGRGGRLICGNSILAFDGGLLPHAAAIAPATFAIRGLTQAAAFELGPHNITVNSYACGPPAEEEIEGAPQISRRLTVQLTHRNFQERESWIEYIPVPRMIFANCRVHLPKKRLVGQDVAQVVSLLASKEADFITGQTISISGGMVMS